VLILFNADGSEKWMLFALFLVFERAENFPGYAFLAAGGDVAAGSDSK
jgi:hypothetical protein